MKSILLTSILLLTFGLQAHATCASAALSVAESAYGNFINRTSLKPVIANKQYLVTVGIGNPEDGPHTFRVTFRDNTCNPKNVQVCDLTQPGYGPSKRLPVLISTMKLLLTLLATTLFTSFLQ